MSPFEDAGRTRNVEALLDAIEDGVLLMGRDGRVVLANAAATRRYGRGGASLENRTLLELDLSEDAVRLWLQWIRRVADLGRPGYFEDETKEYVHDMAMFPVRGRGQDGTRVAVVVRDVTQARRNLRELQMARRVQAHLADRLETLELKLIRHGGRGAMLGASPVMEEVFLRLDQAMNLDTPVLVTGEPGTGKGLAAQAVHRSGERSSGPLERVECAGTEELLLESELFGHVPGAFAGAGRARKGRLAAADRGVLCLDGVDSLPLRLQRKLREFLESGRVEPLGADGEGGASDVRLVATTTADLAELVRRGAFREDLYYQLRVMTVPLPPLRERGEDITLLAEHFLAHYGTALRKELRSISPEAMQAMLTHLWPGNVRELRHAMEHAAIRCAGAEVLPIHLPSDVVTGPRTTDTGRDAGSEAVLRALTSCRWNKTRAAKLLGISRGTLYTRMKAFGLFEQSPK